MASFEVEDKQGKTAFRTQYSHFEYQVILFQLFNILTNFQGYINKIIAKKLNIFARVYLDNILIYTKDPSQSHIEAVQLIFNILEKYNLYFNLKKF